jgi:hypothetical protein
LISCFRAKQEKRKWKLCISGILGKKNEVEIFLSFLTFLGILAWIWGFGSSHPPEKAWCVVLL